MTTTIKIQGMSCNHCKNRVETVLNALDGVQAVVNLEAQQVEITLQTPVDDALLLKTVTDAGYDAQGIVNA